MPQSPLMCEMTSQWSTEPPKSPVAGTGAKPLPCQAWVLWPLSLSSSGRVSFSKAQPQGVRQLSTTTNQFARAASSSQKPLSVSPLELKLNRPLRAWNHPLPLPLTRRSATCRLDYITTVLKCRNRLGAGPKDLNKKVTKVTARIQRLLLLCQR